ncbi:MAG: NAD(P)H-dependent oxidoreductase [Bacteroidota bacterium]
MKKILNIISSPRGESSYSNKLGNAIIEKIKTDYPESEIVTRDLNKFPFPHYNTSHLEAFFTPPENHTEIHKQSTKLSDEVINELFTADIIVINVPTWNFSVPSVLKAWIDQISRAGITFKYTENGPIGLITGKKVYLSIASGAVFSEGPYKAYDFVEPYLKAFLSFMGLTDVTTYRVEGLSIPVIQDIAFEKALTSIEEISNSNLIVNN